MTYSVAEIFTSPQGEGVHAGQSMTFIRFVGCSVGKKICQHCDTDFEKPYEWKGGGRFTALQLAAEVKSTHVCLTGGEPLDQDLEDLINALNGKIIHIESSGTVEPIFTRHSATGRMSYWEYPNGAYPRDTWFCVSPKPGFQEKVVMMADEIKVIVPGLGNGEGWPTLSDALRWAHAGKTVFIQPRNEKHQVNMINMQTCIDMVTKYPELRLSPQLHKFLHVR